MDNMTAKVSCFARAYHYNNNSIRIFTDDIAEKTAWRGLQSDSKEYV